MAMGASAAAACGSLSGVSSDTPQAGKPARARGRGPLDGGGSSQQLLCSIAACIHLGMWSEEGVQAVGSRAASWLTMWPAAPFHPIKRTPNLRMLAGF